MRLASWACLMCLAPASVLAQAAVNVYSAEMSVGFGAAPGSLITVGDFLVFADPNRPENSVAISRSNIRTASFQENVLTVVTREAVQTAVGSRTQFAFRVVDASAGSNLLAWSKPGKPAMEPTEKPAATGEGRWEYRVKHAHFPWGECHGNLVFTKDHFHYESVNNVEHSLLLAVKDIKEAKRPNPYRLEIKPFSGNDYTFELEQKGMSSEDFRALTDAIAAARAQN